jgi:hypothetical protein
MPWAPGSALPPALHFPCPLRCCSSAGRWDVTASCHLNCNIPFANATLFRNTSARVRNTPVTLQLRATKVGSSSPDGSVQPLEAFGDGWRRGHRFRRAEAGGACSGLTRWRGRTVGQDQPYAIAATGVLGSWPARPAAKAASCQGPARRHSVGRLGRGGPGAVTWLPTRGDWPPCPLVPLAAWPSLSPLLSAERPRGANSVYRRIARAPTAMGGISLWESVTPGQRTRPESRAVQAHRIRTAARWPWPRRIRR